MSDHQTSSTIPFHLCRVEGCGRERVTKLFCQKHYLRMRNYGTTDLIRPSAEDRFWRSVNKTADGCWLWTAGSRTKQGYGNLRVNGRSTQAHRFSYALHNGPIPNGLHVLHRCDVVACVNPAHLFLGTDADNMADKMAKGRHRALSGEECGTARLTRLKVDEIRARYACGGVSFMKLAREYGVAKYTINAVINRKTWR